MHLHSAWGRVPTVAEQAWDRQVDRNRSLSIRKGRMYAKFSKATGGLRSPGYVEPPSRPQYTHADELSSVAAACFKG